MVATGGRGDLEIFVYKASKTGKFAKQHCLRGHTGWIIQLLFDTENHLLSGSEDATIRLWHVVSGKIIIIKLEYQILKYPDPLISRSSDPQILLSSYSS